MPTRDYRTKKPRYSLRDFWKEVRAARADTVRFTGEVHERLTGRLYEALIEDARRWRIQDMDFEHDLCLAVQLKLKHCIDTRADLDGARFSAYAHRALCNQRIDMIRRKARSIELALPQARSTTDEEQFVEPAPAASAADEVQATELVRTVLCELRLLDGQGVSNDLESLSAEDAAMEVIRIELRMTKADFYLIVQRIRERLTA